jgi:hypothetical protein
MEMMVNDLAMSKKTVLSLLKTSRGLFRTTGEGVKNKPILYYPMLTEDDHQVAKDRKAAVLSTTLAAEHAN